MTTGEGGDAQFADPAGKVILLVDDDHSMIELLTTVLSHEGFQVETAGSAAEAIAKANQRAPDLIVADLMMPNKGGYDLVRELPAEGISVPVIVATGRNIDESTMKMIRGEANVVDFITKPIKIGALSGFIHKTLKTKPKAGGPAQGTPKPW